MGCTLIRPILLLLCSLLCGSALSERLDESLSPQQQINIQLDWKNNLLEQDALSQKEFNRVIARANNVDTRLDTSKYLGKNVQIYLSLPIQSRGLTNPHGLDLSWTTNGLFLAGKLTPGNRQLIFEGRVTQPVMIDIFNFTFELDGRDVNQTLHLEPVYEIENVTP